MRFYIIFYTNVMSGHVMSGLTLLCADLRFGLPRASPPPQGQFRHAPAPHHAKKADCKAIRQSQSTSPILHQPIPPSKAPAISATSESGTRTYLPSGTNHFPTGLSAPALTASTANFFPATQKNIIAASIAPSGQI